MRLVLGLCLGAAPWAAQEPGREPGPEPAPAPPAEESQAEQQEKPSEPPPAQETPPQPEPSVQEVPKPQAEEPEPAPANPAPTLEDPPPAAAAPVSTGDVLVPPQPAYAFLEDRDSFLARWQASGLVQPLALGTSAGGRELFAVQFGAPGARPLAERTTLFLLGGLDGVSMAGSQAVLSTVSELLADPGRLPPEVAFVAVPWANPDGLARWRASGTGDGRNDRTIDDDGDGEVDEDGPDDLDRDGMVLEMLLEDPLGPWVRAADPRFLRSAREGEAPRYLRLREGLDDDGDGRFNEDGPGGVLLDRNFPVGWEDCKGPESGPWPLSEPDAKALAELLMARRAAVVLVFQGNHGLLASPGGRTRAEHALPLPEDGPTYRRLAEVFSSHAQRDQAQAVSLAEARGEPWPGSLVDWSYAALGALAMEIGVWGPEVEVGRRGPVDAQFKGPEGNGKNGAAPGPSVPEIGLEQAWARWLDDTRGGSGFLDWQPVQLGGQPGAWVGGWEPDTILNPPLDALPEALAGLTGFVSDLASSLPRLEIDAVARREGKVCLVKARVKNSGLLPSGVGPGSHASAVRLRLVVSPGMTLRAGQLETVVGHLPGRGTSDEYGWLLIAPEGALLRIVAESAWSAPIEREVRL
ncbi:MAG TPA: M14 family zinc carboxypeptidase [Planctomycetota bacterium]